MPVQNKRKENFNRQKVRFLSILSFGIGFLDAFFLYIISSYFASLSGEGFVGGFYFIIYIGVLLVLMYLQPILHRIGSVRLLLLLYTVLIGASFFLSLSSPNWLGAITLLFFLVANNVIGPITDIILEDFSADTVSGRVRGFYLTVLNTGLLLAPFASTWTLAHYGYEGVFTVLTIGYAIVLITAIIGLRHHRTYSAKRIYFLTTLQKVIQQKNLLYIYSISWLLEFFYIIMIVYSPLLLRSFGYSWTDIGSVFTFMLIPFVLLQYPLGVLADKKWGEKELLFLSIVLIGITTTAVALLKTHALWLWGILLFATRIGAAGIEVLRDSYFYKQISKTDADIVAFFRTARPVANIFASIIGLFFLSLFPLQSIFLLIAAFAGGACFSALMLQDSQSERERDGN